MHFRQCGLFMLSLRAISKPTTTRKQYILFYSILARYSWSSDILQPRENWLPNKRSARKYCDTFLENTITPEGPIYSNLCRHDVVEIQPRYNEPTLIVRQCSFEVALAYRFSVNFLFYVCSFLGMNLWSHSEVKEATEINSLPVG